MKLWQKVFLCSFAMVVLAIDITLVVTLNLNFRSTIERETNRAALQNAYYKENLQSQIVYQRLIDNKLRLNPEQVEALIEEMVSVQNEGKDQLVVCRKNGEEIAKSSYMAGDPLSEEFKKQVQESSDMLSQVLDFEDRTFMLTGVTVTLETEKYMLYTVSDVTDIYEGLDRQIQFGQAAGLVFASIIGIVLVVMSVRLLRPLSRINHSLRNIADGDYSLRLPADKSPEFNEIANNINRMSESIEQNVAEVQGLADQRQRFVDNFAHEMKTPLTSIMGFADLIRIQKEMSARKRQEYAGIIVDQTKRLQSLSAKMLQLSSLTHTELDWQQMEINTLFFDVYKTVLPVMTTRKVHLKIKPCQGHVRVDRDLFELLLSNLLDNAGKASKEGDTVRMWAQQEEHQWKFFVQDEGVGIGEEDLLHIREPFYMVDKSRSRKSGGVGLGLALCAQIVALHGADLQIESTLGEGTMITVVLPQKKGGEVDEKAE